MFKKSFLLHVDSELEYEQVTMLLNNLLDVVRDDSRHPLYSLVAAIGDLIEAYEIDHEPSPPISAGFAS